MKDRPSRRSGAPGSFPEKSPLKFVLLKPNPHAGEYSPKIAGIPIDFHVKKIFNKKKLFKVRKNFCF